MIESQRSALSDERSSRQRYRQRRALFRRHRHRDQAVDGGAGRVGKRGRAAARGRPRRDPIGDTHPRRARCRRGFMSHINGTINGRQYRMACEEGQEVRLLKLAEGLESRIQSLRGKFGEIGDARLVVMAALTACDELLDANNRIRNLEEELDALRDVRVAAADRARATQTAVANALNAAADRIEKTTEVLNRTIGGGVAIG